MAVFNQAPFVKNRPIGREDAQGRVIPNSFANNAYRAEYSAGNMIYSGIARPGASEGSDVWQIFKGAYDGSGNLTSITWPEDANGNASSESQFSWTDRATYTYS